MVSSRTASAPPQKKCKKRGLPHYLMRQPLSIGSVLGNRTPDSAVRGLRLNLLTNTPYSLIIYAVQRKIYYTEELPSCPVLFLFFQNYFWGRTGTEVSAGRFAPRSPRSLIPSFRGANSSHNSRPECAISPTSGPAGVCSQLPAKPYAFVPGSKFFT